MSYVTAAELETYLGAVDWLVVTDRDGDGTSDTEAVTTALENASSEADSYISRWLPIETAPAVLKGHVLAIAVHMLAGDRETEKQRKRYEDAIFWLRDVAKGNASLGIPPIDEDGDDSGVMVVSSQRRAMRRDQTRGLL